MQKMIYVRVYFDPSGKTGLVNVFASDPAVLDWMFNQVKREVHTVKMSWEGYDLAGARVEFQLGGLEGKEREVMNSVVRLLCEQGYEPYAHDHQNYMHFRRQAQGY
jgi:hypothetical protein